MAIRGLLSNVDLIRRFVFEHEPVSVDEIAGEIRRQMQSVTSDEVAHERYVLPVLHGNAYYRQDKDGRWRTVLGEMPEYRALPEVMREQHQLMYEREVRSCVAHKLEMKVLSVVLNLERAPGMKRFGSRWGLADWVLANDEAAEVLKQHPGGLSEKDLQRLAGERCQLDAQQTILDLKGDKQKRFVADRKLWVHKEHYDKAKAAKDKKVTLPKLREKAVDLALEGSFLQAQGGRGEEAKLQVGPGRARLKKALKKQVAELIEQREESALRQEDLAARLSQVFGAAGIDEYGLQSFQRVETVSREHSLSAKEREDFTRFIDQLLEQETVGVGMPLGGIVSAPLSARKVLDVLRLKYVNYTRDRSVIPPEFYRLLIEILSPTPAATMLNPSCLEGNLAVELLNYLYDRLEGAAWALDDGGSLEIVQPDGAHFSLVDAAPELIEAAKDKRPITQIDLIGNYVDEKFTGIESDQVLARAARIILRLSGYENVYIANRDYFTELPEVFGMPPSPDGQIPHRFGYIIGNFAFSQDANLAATYLEQSLSLLAPGGRLGVFVQQQLLSLLKEHALLGDFLQGMALTHFVRLPLIEGRDRPVLAIVRRLVQGEEAGPIVSAEVRDFKSALNLGHALQKREGVGETYQLVDQMALATIIA